MGTSAKFDVTRRMHGMGRGVIIGLLMVIVMLIGWNIALVTMDKQDKQSESSSQSRSRRGADDEEEVEYDDDHGYYGAPAEIFTRWGRTVCPQDTEQVYHGVAANTHITHAGGGSNYLCMPHDPMYLEFTAKVDNQGILYGSEYQTATATLNAPFSSQNARIINDHNVPCAVCRVRKATVMMLPGRPECYEGWVTMYEGYLMAGHYTNKGRTEFVCVDADPQADEAGYRNEDGGNFYQVEGVCGALPCPPYEPGREITCSVCAK